MISEVLKEQNIELSEKGIEAMYLAMKDVLHVDTLPQLVVLSEQAIVRVVMLWELQDKDAIDIMQKTIRYCKLWGFA